MNYKFPQFEAEISNPIVIIVKKSQPDLDVDLITIQVKLKTEEASLGVTLIDVVCTDTKNADFMALAITALEKFKTTK